MNGLNREWDAPDVREQILNEIQNLEEIGPLYKLLDRVEEAFADPYQVTYKKDAGADGMQGDEQDIQQSKDADQDVEM